MRKRLFLFATIWYPQIFNIENTVARDTFDVHFLSLYCSNEELESRLLSRPEWKNAGEGAIGFINVMKGMNMKYQHLFIESKIDTSDISLNESVSKVNEWIMSCM